MRIRGYWAVAVLALTGCELPLDDDGGGFGFGDFSFSRGYAFVRSDRNVYLADDANLGNVQPVSTSSDARHPALSPNGNLVVFAVRTGSAAELQSAPTTLDGAPSTLLAATSQATNFRHPTFSPDGRTIAFVFDQGGTARIGKVNADGTQFDELAGSASVSFGAPSFMPDGLAVLAPAGTPGRALSQVARIPLATGVPQYILGNLGAAQAIENRVAVSPSGTRVAFDGRVDLGSRIFVFTLSGSTAGTPVQLTDSPDTVNDTFPAWSADSQLVYSSDSGGNDAVYRVDASGAGSLEPQIGGALEPSYGPN